MLDETLQRFGKKQATSDQVMRALVHHDAWWVPAVYAVQQLKTEVFEHATLFGSVTKLPPGEIWFFSDRVHAQRAADSGALLGTVASPLRGFELFASLPEKGFASVRVNPGAPSELTWFIKADAFAVTKLWASSARLEKLLVGEIEGGLITELLDYPGLQLFVLPNGAIATAVGAAGLKNPGMVFTAPDCADALLATAGPEAAKTLKRVTVSGADVFQRFEIMGIDGLLFNPSGPGKPKVLGADLCREIEKLRKDRTATP